jgi:hypothetical protein
VITLQFYLRVFFLVIFFSGARGVLGLRRQSMSACDGLMLPKGLNGNKVKALYTVSRTRVSIELLMDY